jgi:glycerophosphoryl diester phosphodiesterase
LNRPIVIGHRGAAAHAPENTLHSFQTAFEMGADMVELDVHETNDGNLVCMHDYDVSRTTNGTGLIHDMSLREIKKLKIQGTHEIPLLSEILEYAKNKFSVNIEIKVPDIEMKIVELVNKYEMNHEIIISSFLHGTLPIIKSIDSSIKTAVLLNEQLENPVEYALQLNTDGINPLFYTLDPMLVQSAHTAHLVIHPWTVNFEDSMIELIKAGVDGIITDYPDVARRVIDSLL